ncbi:phosphatase inhibitor-domain-containing protein [Massariosphaeria phaeospora]|uniref:Type 1 phosphatases regulator n=1 Tax=Massariosphaeria phaeospora TaxID=100035 RepID=A0A7C8I798_9PLEO|nr:phosphatase inhibitor-domain-containing protein [Massariosphaeria phaeospora]
MASSNNVSARVATPANSTTTIEARAQPVLRLSAPSGTLRLRAEPVEERHIQWAEDVIDNEGMGKKSSKVCCIYHKPREVDESSDDSSSDSSSDSDSDSETDNSRAQPVGGRSGGNPRGRRTHSHKNDDDGQNHEHDHAHGENSGLPQRRTRPHRKPSPNAYEKMPKQRN